MKKKKSSLLSMLRYKAWFILDLPYVIKQHQFKRGVELGAKGGRSMYFMLRANKELHLMGVDKWEVIKGSAYKNNDRNEERCKRRLRAFSKRVQLIKGEAMEISNGIEDGSLDFVHYDLQSQPMHELHQQMIAQWMKKIRTGGLLIGRDFRDFRQAFFRLGIEEKDIKPCRIGRRVSERLEYVKIR